MNELCLRYWQWATSHYRDPDGNPTPEQVDIRHALRPFRELLGHAPAREVGPLEFKRVRDAMVDRG